MRPKAALSWSSGKDAAWTYEQSKHDYDIVALFTTVNLYFSRVAMHGARQRLLELQAERLGVPLHVIGLPWPCSNADYEAAMEAGLAELPEVTHLIFGDLFLEDIRDYRVKQLAQTAFTPVFPLFGRDTAALAREMIDGGLRARLVCVDPKQIDPSFAGRAFDAALLADLPDGVDPCGENGEFHTLVVDHPSFSAPIDVVAGEVVERDGFVYADFLSA